MYTQGDELVIDGEHKVYSVPYIDVDMLCKIYKVNRVVVKNFNERPVESECNCCCHYDY